MGSAQQMLPGALGTPAGAVTTLLRSVGYFDGARSAGPWSILAAWAAAGPLLVRAVRPRPAASTTQSVTT